MYPSRSGRVRRDGYTTAARLQAEAAQDIAIQSQSHPKPAKALPRTMLRKPEVNITDAT